MHKFSGFTCFITLAFSFMANAHVPALSQEQRDSAPYIIEGTVLSRTETFEEKYEGFSDYLYKVTLQVNKANVDTYAPGSTFTFTYWHAAERPDGMTGDMGQNEDIKAGLLMRAGKNVRIYALENEELLNPNGFDVIKKEPVLLKGLYD